MRLDAGVQFFHLKRLGKVIHPADGKGLHLVQRFGESADEDNGNPVEIVIGLELFAHLVTVHLRHVDIQQDQMGPPILERLDGFRSVIRQPDLESDGAEKLGQ